MCWVRLQIHEFDIQTSTGTYDWSRVDTAVSFLNAAGIHIDFPIQCFSGSCFSNPVLPTVGQMIQYASALASRYDGKHGHGVIDAFEIGNEEYDFFPPSAYGPPLEAGYQAIKAVDPSAMVGTYGVYRSYRKPSAKAPVIHPLDEAAVPYVVRRGSSLRAGVRFQGWEADGRHDPGKVAAG